MSISEGLLEHVFCTLRVIKERRSEGSAPCIGGTSAGSALASGSASEVEGGGMGRLSDWRDS